MRLKTYLTLTVNAVNDALKLLQPIEDSEILETSRAAANVLHSMCDKIDRVYNNLDNLLKPKIKSVILNSGLFMIEMESSDIDNNYI